MFDKFKFITEREEKDIVQLLNEAKSEKDFIPENDDDHEKDDIKLDRGSVEKILKQKEILPKGRYSKINEILDINGIGEAKLNIILELVRQKKLKEDQNKLIGSITVTPEYVVPGQSVLIEVKSPNGEPYSKSSPVSIRINGVRGPRQFLQFDTPRTKTINVLATSDKKVERTTVNVHVVSKNDDLSYVNQNGIRILSLSNHPSVSGPPIIFFNSSIDNPYLASFSVGQNWFSVPSKRKKTNDIPQYISDSQDFELQTDFLANFEENTTNLAEAIKGAHLLLEKQHDLRNNKFVKSKTSNRARELPPSNIPNLVATPVPGGINVESMNVGNIPNDLGDIEIVPSLTYHFDFGDGEYITTQNPLVEHDFRGSLSPNQEHHYFDIKVRIEVEGLYDIEVSRTLYIHNSYALCKSRGYIIPKVDVTTYAKKALNGWEGTAIINNVEPYPLLLTSRLISPLLEDDLEENQNLQWREEQLEPNIIVPPLGALSLPVTASGQIIPLNSIGFSAIYCGESQHGGNRKQVRVETYFEFEPKYRDPVQPRNPNVPMVGDISFTRYLNVLRRNIAKLSVLPKKIQVAELKKHSRDELNKLIKGQAVIHHPILTKSSLPSSINSIRNYSIIDRLYRNSLKSNLGLLQAMATMDLDKEEVSDMGLGEGFLIFSMLQKQGLLTNAILVNNDFEPSPPVEGQECDPNNLPDDIYDDQDTDWVCQATPETREVPVFGRFINARKGDVILSPSGPALIGQLLLQVSPSQRYSHSGIMTRNFDQITHCTASEDRILAYPVGDIFGDPAPTNGHRPDVVKYGWPGVITQTVDNSIDGEYMADPEDPDSEYLLTGFSKSSSYVDVGGHWEIIPPLVVKPDPIFEARDRNIRSKLRQVASNAFRETGRGHYRFYCYTDPSVSEDPNFIAPNNTGWAAGTWPAVCSSFVWSMLKRNGVNLEGNQPIVDPANLEQIDRAAGAQVGPNTRDGLYLYTAEERRAGADFLFNELKKMVERSLLDEAGDFLDGIIDYFSDMSNDVANQIVNAFESDWAATESKDSDRWKDTTEANAVSPDNILFWDSPDTGGLYGYPTPLIYRPQRIETVKVHSWRKVRVKGTVHGTVRYRGVPQARVVVQLNDQHTAITDLNGNYSIDHVHYGDYVVNAATDLIEGVRLSGSRSFTLDNARERLDLNLQGPSGLYRRLEIQGELMIHDNHFWGSDPERTVRFHRELFLGPFNTYGEGRINTSVDDGDNRVLCEIDAFWNVDRSIRIAMRLTESGENQRTYSSRGFTIPPGASWRAWINLGRQADGHDHSNVNVNFRNLVNNI